ncbi:trypco2 family protein [Streptomyces sp. NPDC046887]|uniref:trypco2 family protein n=1 Tax=Streptomyces sp. NPDC046887 TaxID=3155472 RepID=UPI0033EC7C08
MADDEGATGQQLDLVQAITLLRDQIAEAQRLIDRPPARNTDPGAPATAADKGVRFTLGEITLELGMELTRTRGVDGGLRWSVIGFGGRKESGATNTHTLTVTLTPHKPGGGDIDVRDTE